MPQLRQRNQGSPNSGAPMGAVDNFGGRSAQDPIARVTWLLTRRAARRGGARAGAEGSAVGNIRRCRAFPDLAWKRAGHALRRRRPQLHGSIARSELDNRFMDLSEAQA